MKLKDVLAVCKWPTWFKPSCSWKLEGDKVVIVPDAEVTLDTEVHVDYFWYDHLEPKLRKNGRKIDEAIEAHDWKTYQEWRTYIDEDNPYNPLCYFPNEVAISTADAHVGWVSVFSQDVFNLIEHSEHECG